MKQFLIKTYVLLLSFLAAFPLFAQQVSTTTQALPGSAIGTTILVPINTSNITASYGNIIIATIRVTYDPAVLTYTGLSNINAGIPTSQLTVNPAGGGVLQVNIEDPAFTGFPYPDGKSFDIQFTLLGGSSAITITKAEFLNAAFATNNSPVVNGNVSVSTDPFITVAPTALTGFTYIQGAGPSTEQSFTVSGIFLTNNISIAASANYEISKTSGSGYTTPLTLIPTTGTVPNTTIYVRLKAGLSGGSYNGEVINITSTGATPKTVTSSGTVIFAVLSAGTLNTFGTVCINSTAGPNSFTITGSNLSTGSITVGALTGFAYSATAGGPFTSTLAFPQTGGAFSATVYVTLTPTLTQSYNGNITISGGGATSVNVAATGNGNGASPADAGAITGPTTICQNTNGVQFTIASIPNATSYVWSVPSGATIVSGSGSNLITVNFGSAISGNITAAGSNICGTGTQSSLALTLVPLPIPIITGSTSTCAGSIGNSYVTTAGMTGYIWTVSAGGTINSGSGTNTVSVTWNTAGAQTVSVNYTNANSCTATTPTIYPVTVNSLPVPILTGLASICAGSAGNSYVTTAGMTGYTWTVSAGGTINSGSGTNTISVTWNTAGAQTVSVNYTNGNNCTASAPTAYPVTVYSPPLPVVTGLASVCSGSTGNSYATTSGMTGYTWTVSSGGTINSGSGTNTISVTWNAAGAQTVNVNYTNAGNCNASAPTVYPVTVYSPPLPVITGSASVCSGSTGNSYATTSGMTGYTWAVSSGGTINSGSGSNSISVTWNTAGAQTVSVNYTNAGNCTASSPTVYPVAVNAPPVPVITIAGLTLTSNALLGNQWYRGNVLIQGATNPTYIVTQNGIYTNIVTLNGCSSAVSNSINVTSVGVDNVSAEQFVLYPVPNNGLFTAVMVSPKIETFTIRVYNNVGSQIYEKKDILVNRSVKQTIDLRNALPGMYTVTFTSGIKRVISKMIINPN